MAGGGGNRVDSEYSKIGWCKGWIRYVVVGGGELGWIVNIVK